VLRWRRWRRWRNSTGVEEVEQRRRSEEELVRWLYRNTAELLCYIMAHSLEAEEIRAHTREP
jgi:hypothetical protein